MKKKHLAVALALSAGLTLIGCGEGNNSASSNNRLNIQHITLPAGFTQLGAPGSSDVFVDLAKGEISFIIDGASHIFKMPADLLSELKGLTNLDTVKVDTKMNVADTYSVIVPGTNHVYLLTPTLNVSSVHGSNVNVAAASDSIKSVMFTNGDVAAITSNVYPVSETQEFFGGVSGGENKLFLVSKVGDVESVEVSMKASDCDGVQSTEKVTAVATLLDFGKPTAYDYLGMGTESGSVCVFYRGHTDTTKTGVQNLSVIAENNNHGYVRDVVNAPFGFYAASSDANQIIGIWHVGDQLYRINGMQDASSGAITPESFWDLTKTGSQTSTHNGQSTTLTFANGPSSVPVGNFAVMDTKGSIWASNGSNDSIVYQLPLGSTTWNTSESALPWSTPSNVGSLYPTGTNGIGVYVIGVNANDIVSAFLVGGQ